jgi:pyrroline-5-carboxylate reductase
VFPASNQAAPTSIRLGFAGAGNMAAAMARGWARGREDGSKSSAVSIESITFADAGSGRAAELATELGGETVGRVGDLAERANVLVLAMKPAALDEVASELNSELRGDTPLAISVLAGVSLERLDTAFPGLGVLRAMPNIPVEVRQGVICYVPPSGDLPAGGDPRIELLGLLGTTVAVDEDQIEAATAVMSCSPAYVALMSEALVAAGEREGLGDQVAHELVIDAVAGTAELLRNRDPEAIRHAVASPGGATEAGLDALAERDLEAAIYAAVQASLERMRQ